MEELQKVFDKHKLKLETMKENRSLNCDDWSDEQNNQADECIKILASILSDLNKIINEKN